jgi:hypothetical protein
MNTLFLLAATALALCSCEALTQQRPKGTYRRTDYNEFRQATRELEFSDTKCTMPRYNGLALNYTVEGGYVYVGPAEGAQIRFQVVSPDTLINNESFGFEGTYVRVRQ